MKAKHVLAIHTAVLASFVVASLSSPYIATHYLGFFSAPVLVALAILAVAVMASWNISGGCPFTVWENRLRASEDPSAVYSDGCINHYVHTWSGLRLPNGFSTGILVILLALPVVSGIAW